MTKLPPHIKRTRAKGKDYYYFDSGMTDKKGKRIWKPCPGPRERNFGSVYSTLLGHRSRRTETETFLTFAQMVELYQASPKYAVLSVNTRKLYGIYLTKAVEKLGPAPAEKLERREILVMIDKMAARPGAANMVLASIRACYTWARKREHVTNDPCREIDPLDLGEHEPWPDHVLEAALAADDDKVRLATHLLYYTAQRIGDVLKMRWTDIQGDVIIVKPSKTKRFKTVLEIRIHTALAAELARHPRSLGTIMIGSRPGKAAAETTVRDSLQKFCSDLGHHVVPHGLRKNAINALLEAGCSAAEAASISGQSLQMVEHYAKKRAQGRLAQAAILKWEGVKK